MLSDTLGLSLQRFLDRRHSLCSLLVQTTAGMLHRNSNTLHQQYHGKFYIFTMYQNKTYVKHKTPKTCLHSYINETQSCF